MAKKHNVKINGYKYFKITKTVGHDEEGKAIKKQFYGDGEKEAKQLADEFMDNINNGMSIDYNVLNISSLVSTWLYDIKYYDTKFKPASFDKYEGIYRNYIKKSQIAPVKVFSCKTIVIQKYYNELSEKGKSESQIHNLNKVLKGAFKYAIQEGYIKTNPCEYTVIPKVETDDFDETEDDDSEIDFFSLNEISKIIKCCNDKINNKDNDYLPYLILFSLGTGLRQGEALGLQKRYLKNYATIVKKELCKFKKYKDRQCVGYEYKLLKPKTPNSDRIVDMPTTLFDKIDNYINNIVKYIYKENDILFNDKSLIFINENANIIDPSNLRKRWKKFLFDLDIDFKKWHSLRSSYASLLFYCGADIKTVQELLGHADINTTLAIYLKIYPETKKNAVNLLNEKLT